MHVGDCVCMTGTWRDTLFLWRGNLQHARGEEYSWEGGWIGCQGSPDARTAATPNDQAFAETDMKFEVKGTGQQAVGNFWKLELTGGPGWDLGEGAGKKRHRDSKHTLYMKHMPDQQDCPEKGSVVVALGENDFGHFVSAGYVMHSGEEIMLGRRYLAAGDVRARWSVEELYQHIVASDRGAGSLFSRESLWHPSWRGCEVNYRVAPWRTIALHSQKLTAKQRGKRKRDEDQSRDTLPVLYIPLAEHFSPNLTVTTSLQTVTRIQSKVRWVEQCHGCGRQLDDPFATSCKEVVEQGPDEILGPVCYSLYCTAECACTNGAPAWVEAVKAYQRPGHSLKSNGQVGFWSAARKDKKVMQSLIDAGWTKEDDYFVFLSRNGGENADS